MARFHVYKASAGSGKTFTISKAFIRRLLADEKAYRHMLAITFTNKATGEMKRRIIAYLAGMAEGKEEEFVSQILSDIREDICKGIPVEKKLRDYAGMPEGAGRQSIRDAAGRLLHHILHDYGRLSVMTIDSFFQRIIRSFAMDTGLFAGYELQLDQDEAVEQAVDLFTTALEPGSEATGWITAMAEDRMNEGRNWNLRNDLLTMSRMLLQEYVQAIPDKEFEQLSTRGTLKQYRDELMRIRKQYEQTLQETAARAMEIMKRHRLEPQDFAYGNTGIGGAFSAIAQGSVKTYTRLIQGVGQPEKWYKKGAPEKDRIEQAYEDGLNEAAGQIAALWEQEAVRYNSACLILKHLSLLGIMAELRTALQDYCREQDLFLIAQSNIWLHRIIDGADTPFIYERTGLRFHNYMIDEMQDTSHLQWSNLKPLLSESMAANHDGWSVGDVKQSIYRFRNGDWRIMEGQIGRDIRDTCTHRLDFNYRSAKNIIEFNNSFIQALASTVSDMASAGGRSDQIHRIYSDLEQQIPKRRLEHPDGLIEMRFLPDSDETSWKDTTLASLPGRIMYLENNGFRASDIAILVRDNTDAAAIMKFMLDWVALHADEAGKYTFDMLYNEALYIDDAVIVQWVTGALTYLTDPDEPLNRTFLSYAGSLYLELDADTLFERLDAWRSQVQGLSVYEATAALTERMELYRHTGSGPYLQAFLDYMADYCRRQPVDPATFLSFWTKNAHKQHLTMPDQQDAIRLMTIHKAKGLEFGAVIMPFADWPVLKANRNIVWFPTSGTPFNMMEQVPVSLSSALENSIFDEPYKEERFLSMVDNLNLLYVAFTRACRVLMVDAPLPKKDDHSKENRTGWWLYQTWKHRTREEWTGICEEGPGPWEGEGFRTGRLLRLAPERDSTPTARMMDDLYQPAMRRDADTRIKDSGAWFDADPQADATARGIVLHELFSRVRRLEDLPAGLDTLAAEGMISAGDKKKLTAFVQRACQLETIRQWFSERADVKTEAELLLPDGTRYRPDRVVIGPDGAVQVVDFKFGTRILHRYHRQVEAYMQTLRRMGYQTVTGYLWYVSLDRIERV